MMALLLGALAFVSCAQAQLSTKNITLSTFKDTSLDQATFVLNAATLANSLFPNPPRQDDELDITFDGTF